MSWCAIKKLLVKWLDRMMVWRQSCAHSFDFRSVCYQLVKSTWMGDCLLTGKTSWYISNTNVNSAFHPFGVGKSNLFVGLRRGIFSRAGWQVCDLMWQVMLYTGSSLDFMLHTLTFFLQLCTMSSNVFWCFVCRDRHGDFGRGMGG